MSGNVPEWCNDWYGSYTAGAATDPTGAASGTTRIFRGGSKGDPSSYISSAFRNYDDPQYGHFYEGVRVVLPR